MIVVNATLAQSAEQSLRKREVVGSIPTGGSAQPRRPRGFFRERGEMRWQQAVERTWQGLNSNALLLGILIALLGVFSLTFLFPQAPVPPSDAAAFTRWLVEIRPLLGNWEKPLTVLGLLSLRHSLWIQVPLALLALSLAVRWISLAEGWRGLSRRQRGARLLVGIGGVAILLGWGAQTRWGWIEPNVIAWQDEAITVPDWGVTLSATAGSRTWLTDRYGVYLLPERWATGVAVQVLDQQGRVLSLVPSTRGAPQERFRFALTPQAPEAYFAAPAAGLIFRLELSPAAEGKLMVQGFRSATGEAVKTVVLQGDEIVPLDGVRLVVTYLPLRHLRVIYNPGAVPQAVGLLILALGAWLQLWPIRAGQTAVFPSGLE